MSKIKIMENLNTIPTAAEFLKSDNGFDDNDMELLAKSLKTENRMDISDICQTMVEFVKLHREAVLKSVIENVDFTDYTYQSMQQGSTVEVDKDSILDAYPVTLIK